MADERIKLEEIGSIAVPAFEQFAVSEHYKIGTIDGVEVLRVSFNFVSFFEGFVESGGPAQDLRIHQARSVRYSVNASNILKALNNRTIFLGQFWDLHKAEAEQHKRNILHLNGKENSCFALTTQREAVVVISQFRKGGWEFDAFSIETNVALNLDELIFSA